MSRRKTWKNGCDGERDDVRKEECGRKEGAAIRKSSGGAVQNIL